MSKYYSSPIGITSQLRHCGNCFRIDMYKGCDFGCIYCFANGRGGNIQHNFQEANIETIKRKFKKAFETQEESKDITIELLRHKVPLHCGGMADPFQSREWTLNLTYQLIELSNKYQYPIIFSTKTDHLEQKYYDILNPEIHAFQCSLISINNDFLQKFEKNAPVAENRINFIKELKKRGFWVSIRLQPLVNLEEGKLVVSELSDVVDFITVEHLKIANDNNLKRDLFLLSETVPSQYKCTGRNYELLQEEKENNINELKKISKCPIGCGDNDLHQLSDSLNCCGIDLINDNFSNWLKYNAMYIKKTNDRSQWYPQNSCHGCFNSECVHKDFTYKDYVEDYISKPLINKKCRFKL